MRSMIALALLIWAGTVRGEDPIAWGVSIQQDYRLVPDVTYLVADGYESKLDVVAGRDNAVQRPTLLYIHGGGWVGGDKDQMFLHFLPYLAMGFAVVNVEYRLGNVALAPAAVEDARCALRWLLANAQEYGFDADRIVVSGHSAGGHLSLTTGMLPSSAGLDRRCPARNPDARGRADAHEPEMPVAAIVNWFGITDVADLLDGPNMKGYAVQWLGSMTDRNDVARRVSPMTYVRPDLPPIITIHGDADPTVPYPHAVRLHEALTKAGVPNELVTIPGGRHGGFGAEQDGRAYAAIEAFLTKHGIIR